MEKKDLLQAGVITSPHGVRGEVKVFPTTDNPERFELIDSVIVQRKQDHITMKVESVKYFKNMVILKLDQIHNMDEAELYRQCPLLITREQSEPCQENENFICDLIGLTVIDDENNTLGTLVDVLQTGANDVYVVHGESEKDILLPAIPSCVLNVDLEKQVVTVHVLPGLLDL